MEDKSFDYLVYEVEITGISITEEKIEEAKQYLLACAVEYFSENDLEEITVDVVERKEN